jgi:hypothetical protein
MSEPNDDDDKYAGLLQLLAQDAEEEEGELCLERADAVDDAALTAWAETNCVNIA